MVTNPGAAAGPEFWYDEIYVSNDPILDFRDVGRVVLQRGPLGASQFYTATQSLTLHTPASGRYYIFLHVDTWSYVYEASETNNQLIATIDVELVLPDLVVSSVSVPPVLVSGRDFAMLELAWVVQNQGAGTVEVSWYDSVYINGWQRGGNFDHDSGSLAPGDSYTNTARLYLDAPTNGLYAVTLWADNPDYDQILEINETNNSRTVWFELVRSPREIVLADEDGSVPLWFASTSSVSTLAFDLIYPGQKLYSLYSYEGVPELWYSDLSLVGQNRYFARMEAYAGESFSGAQELARIFFDTWLYQPSGFASFSISNLVARTEDGLDVPNVSLRAGRAVIIGAEPLLEATSLSGGQYSLTLYGHPNSNVVLEAQTSLTEPTWDTIWQGPLSNRFQILGPFPATDRSRFYRAHY